MCACSRLQGCHCSSKSKVALGGPVTGLVVACLLPRLAVYSTASAVCKLLSAHALHTWLNRKCMLLTLLLTPVPLHTHTHTHTHTNHLSILTDRRQPQQQPMSLMCQGAVRGLGTAWPLWIWVQTSPHNRLFGAHVYPTEIRVREGYSDSGVPVSRRSTTETSHSHSLPVWLRWVRLELTVLWDCVSGPRLRERQEMGWDLILAARLIPSQTIWVSAGTNCMCVCWLTLVWSRHLASLWWGWWV